VGRTVFAPIRDFTGFSRTSVARNAFARRESAHFGMAIAAPCQKTIAPEGIRRDQSTFVDLR